MYRVYECRTEGCAHAGVQYRIAPSPIVCVGVTHPGPEGRLLYGVERGDSVPSYAPFHVWPDLRCDGCQKRPYLIEEVYP